MSLNDEDREILNDFITEATEGLEKAEGLLLQLEESLVRKQDVDFQLIDSLFRVYHSIKGSAGFLGLQLINRLTHQAESVLDQIRKGKLTLTKQHIDILLEVCDALQIILDYLTTHGEEQGFQTDFSDLLQRLEVLSGSVGGGANSFTRPKSETKPEVVTDSPQFDQEMIVTVQMKKEFAEESLELLEQLEQDLMALEKMPDDSNRLNSIFRALHTIKGNAGFLGFADINQICHKAETIFDLARSGTIVLQGRQISLMLQIIDFISAALAALKEDKPPVIAGKNALLDLMEDVVELPQIVANESANKTGLQGESEPKKSEQQKKALEQTIPARYSREKLSDVIRVDVSKLNKLMDLVGEIVIAESTLLNHYSFENAQNETFLKSLIYLQKNIRELQELATSMRMVPLSGLFGKMQRLVRDIASKKEKDVELMINGAETEVDRSVIEHISDPLIHILRNALDHGIEEPEIRLKKGKPRKGHIRIDVQRVGGQIWITVKDDGQGLNKEKILKRAWERGIISKGHVPENEQKIYNLIFEPGFSTADKITNISGRGVGMDVVQKNIEKIRGSIALSTAPDEGTAIIMKIPLTTAIVDGMLVRAGRTLFAIPLLDIRESVQVGGAHLVHLVDGQEVIKIRDQLIPVIRLEQFYQKTHAETRQNDGIVVISEIAGRAVGFFVDEVLGEQQLVLKPLPRYLGKLEGVSGCAVMGDGAICLILDLAVLLKYAEAVSADRQWKIATVEI